ncbi:MAG: HEAT repeat domain-containing protein [Pirellulales bacterium]
MSFDPSRSPELSPDDALPPVEPPSAGFIVQLFVVPGVIVVVVVMIWVLFNWLAHKGNDRDAFVRALSRNNEARWQAAFNLANALRAERGSSRGALSTDPELARQLADILKSEIETASMKPNPLTLRIYLCCALGEFKVPDGLPTLIEAAGTVRSEKESDVRRAALEGIARLADNVGGEHRQFSHNPELEKVLLEAAADDDPQSRSIAAVALGVIGTPRMLEKLRFMIEDANPNVRYNAAARLSQRGDGTALPVLLEMLDQQETAGVDIEKKPELRPFKRALITINALRAGGQLAAKNRGADLGELKAAAEKLLAGGASGEIRIEATGLVRRLENRAAPESAH